MFDTGPNWLLIGLIAILMAALIIGFSQRKKSVPVKEIRMPARPVLTPQESLRLILDGKMPEAAAKVSPDGKYAVVLNAYEMRMSHWLESGAVWNLDTQTMIVPIGERMWSTDRVTWTGNHDLEVEIRRYPGDVPGGNVRLDVDQQTARIAFDPDPVTIPFEQLNTWLERYYSQRTRYR